MRIVTELPANAVEAEVSDLFYGPDDEILKLGVAFFEKRGGAWRLFTTDTYSNAAYIRSTVRMGNIYVIRKKEENE